MEHQVMRELMCEVGRRIYQREMVAANDGNFSVKIDDNTFLCTPTGISKGFMTPEMICVVDKKGNSKHDNGQYKPSSEVKMHMRVYEERPDVNSVVHAHPQFATAYAIAGIPLTEKIMPEAVIFLGEVPIAKYGLPSTAEIPDAVEPFLSSYDAVLLENHGALSWGNDLMSAYFKMEGLEFYASLAYKAKMLGGAKELPDFEVDRLYDLRRKFAVPGKHPSDNYVRQEDIEYETTTNHDVVNKSIDSAKSKSLAISAEQIEHIVKLVISQLAQ
jgi:L-fuculose-phosphate aldolase